MKSNFCFCQNFSLVGNNFNLEVDGILGQEFFREFGVQLDFLQEILTMKADSQKVIMPIFTFSEALKIQQMYKNPQNFIQLVKKSNDSPKFGESFDFISNEPFVIPSRSQIIISLNSSITHDVVCTGYELESGVFIASCVTSNYIGFLTFLIVNTTDINIKISEFKCELHSISGFLMAKKSSIDDSNRIAALKSIISNSHLNSEETCSLQSLIFKYPHSFYMPMDFNLSEIEIKNGESSLLFNFDLLKSSVMLLIPKKKFDDKDSWYHVVDLRRFEFTLYDSSPLGGKYDLLRKIGLSTYVSMLFPGYGFSGFTFNLSEISINRNDFLVAISGVSEYLQVVYFGKIVLFSETLGGHIDMLSEIFEFYNNFSIKFSPKCSQFLLKNVIYLGHEIHKDKVYPNGEIVEKIKQIETSIPINDLSQLKEFVCYATYLRHFIRKFQTLISPITEILDIDPSKYPANWIAACGFSIASIKNVFKNRPFLNVLNPMDNNYIIGLCSNENVLNISLNRKVDQERAIILFADKPLPVEKHSLPPLDKELECLKFALQNFRSFILNKNIIVQTMNKSISWLLDCTDLSPHYAEYRILLEEFNFEIEYLSQPDMFKIYFLNKDLNEKLPIGNVEKSKYFIKTSRKTPSIEEIPVILHQAHVSEDGTHFPIAKTRNRIMDNYNWAGMDFDLKNFIKRCVCCGKLELLQINKPTGVANVEETLVPFF